MTTENHGLPELSSSAIALGQGVWLSSDSQVLFTEHVRSCMCLVATNGKESALAHIPDRFTIPFKCRVDALMDSVSINREQLTENEHSLTALIDAIIKKVPGADFVLLGGVMKNLHIEAATVRVYTALWIDLVERFKMTKLVTGLIKKYGSLQLPGISFPEPDSEFKEMFSPNPVPYMTKMGCFDMPNVNRVIKNILETKFNIALMTCIIQGGLMNTKEPDFVSMQATFQGNIIFMQKFIPFLESYGQNTSRHCADEIVKAVQDKNLKITDNSCTYIAGVITKSSGLSVAVTPSGDITTWSDCNMFPENKFKTISIPPQLIGSRKGFMHTMSECGNRLVGTWEK